MADRLSSLEGISGVNISLEEVDEKTDSLSKRLTLLKIDD
jgi:hypothetical protein